jgi:hypothetical protein
MKITPKRLAEIAREELKSILNECAECGDMEHHGDVEDYEADMFKGHLFTMAKQAADLNEMVSEQEDIEEWVQEKIAVAANALDTVYDYLVYQKSKDGYEHHDHEDDGHEDDEYYVEFAEE